MLKFKFKPKKETKRTLNKQKQIKRLPCELVRSITEAIPFKLTPGQTASNIYRFQSCLMFGVWFVWSASPNLFGASMCITKQILILRIQDGC